MTATCPREHVVVIKSRPREDELFRSAQIRNGLEGIVAGIGLAGTGYFLLFRKEFEAYQ